MILGELDAAVLGQQRLEHFLVLLLAGAGHVGEAAGRNAQIERHAEGVAQPRAAADADDHLVLAFVLDDLVEQGKDGLFAAIQNAVAADGDDIDVGQDIDLVVRFG